MKGKGFKLDRDLLQKTLQEVDDEITIYDLSKKMGYAVDDVLLYIQNEIIPEYAKIFRKKAFKIPFFDMEQTEEFFRTQIIDLGFLCQHKIKEIKEGMEQKHSSFSHQIFYDKWIMNRGY
jgi:hypothetical protein